MIHTFIFSIGNEKEEVEGGGAITRLLSAQQRQRKGVNKLWNNGAN